MTASIARPSMLPADRPWPPLIAAAPAPNGAIEISGSLVRDAELRMQSDCARGVLLVELSTGRGFNYAASLPVVGDPHSLQDAQALARALRRGTSVRVRALGCHPRIDHGNAVLQLLDPISVAPLEEEA